MSSRYSHVVSRKKEGAHYTPTYIANFIAEQMLENAQLESKITVVDPAIGDGELILSFLKKFDSIPVEVHGFDINFSSLELANSRIKEVFPEANITLHHENFLDYCLKTKTSNELDLFLQESEHPKFDFLIANPPYIRTQNLADAEVKKIAKNFNIGGRLDIYQAFLLGMKHVLKKDAIAGVIVSNRFMTIKGCENFRSAFFNDFKIERIFDFGDSKVFDAAVLPAVLIVKNSNVKNGKIPFNSIYTATDLNLENFEIKANPAESIQKPGLYSISDLGFYEAKKGWLDFGLLPSNPWKLVDSDLVQWQKSVDENTFCRFKDIGKIRVGVKTTADNVFIKNDFNKEIGEKPELVKPLVTHHVANQYYRSKDTLKQIIYTHFNNNGKKEAFDIEKYPITKKYLLENKTVLENRSYLTRSNRKWYEIWVPQDPSLWSEQKVVFRDICEKPTFWLESEDVIINGDCYWFLNENFKNEKEFLFLAIGIANSKFIEHYYDNNFGNKLYSNRRRFMTQYVSEFPIPDPNKEESRKIICVVKKIIADNSYTETIQNALDKLVFQSFGLT
jgi:adenine-specific DNA-methyltransferase